MTDGVLPRYRLGDGVSLIDRGGDLQIGVAAGRRVVLAHAPARARQILAALDGSTPADALLTEDDDVDWWRDTLDRLHRAGLLGGGPFRVSGLREERIDLTHRVGVEHADLALTRRQDAVVEIRGGGRITGLLARTLEEAGVGRVVCSLPRAGARELRPPLPAGSRVEVRRVAAGPLLHPRPTLTVFAADRPLDPLLAREHVAERLDHLAVQLAPGRVVVGPLVLPARSACLWCLELRRTEADPFWPAVRRGVGAPGATAAATAAGAGWAAAEVLHQVEGLRQPLTVDATLEWDGAGLPRRRSWSRHPRCSCRPDGAPAAVGRT